MLESFDLDLLEKERLDEEFSALCKVEQARAFDEINEVAKKVIALLQSIEHDRELKKEIAKVDEAVAELFIWLEDEVA